jgi:hypothetical protein
VGEPDVDLAVLVVFPELVVVEVGTKVCDDAMGQSVVMHELIQ